MPSSAVWRYSAAVRQLHSPALRLLLLTIIHAALAVVWSEGVLSMAQLAKRLGACPCSVLAASFTGLSACSPSAVDNSTAAQVIKRLRVAHVKLVAY